MSLSIRLAAAFCGAALLAACNGVGHVGTPAIPPGIPPLRERPQHRMSWMAGGLAKQDLLYVTNANSEVTVYRYWRHTLVGVLTDFTKPLGECVDAAGNVFIVDAAEQKIIVYTHGGSKPIKTLDDSPDSPYTCAVDPVTGNLAVANNDGASKQGNVAIWTKASGQPTRFTDPELTNFVGCTYDGSGNLLVTNGYRSSYGAEFAWLPRNGTKLFDIKVFGPGGSGWSSVHGIQWDGKYFVLDVSYLYRVMITHGQGYYVGETPLEGGTSGGPYWIYNNKASGQGTQVVGAFENDGQGFVNFWHYPAGGEPFYSLSHGLDEPFGVTISLKKSH